MKRRERGRRGRKLLFGREGEIVARELSCDIEGEVGG